MSDIFYDLETSDRNFMGQIVNYCFIAVDEGFEPVREISGLIRLSRLQLPSPYAIITNRVNVLEHQEQAEDDEFTGLAKIHDFISSVIASQAEKPSLIGFNSSRFDLQYLRTSFVRNGLDPYFSGKLSYRDLLHAATKLSCSKPDFPRESKDDPAKISLSLETLSRALGLLDAAQDHESRSDVLLTIRLAREFKERWGLDVRKFNAYEAQREEPRSGRIFMSPQVLREKEGQGLCRLVPHTLLDSNYRYALWLDLQKFKEGGGRRSIVFLNKSVGMLSLNEEECLDAEWKEVAEKALVDFKKLNLGNYFTTSECDIEQDIYRLDFDAMEALRLALRVGDLSRLRNLNRRDATSLYRRFELCRYQWGSGDDARYNEMLRQYALYRYGGRALLSKYLSEPAEDGRSKGWYHQSYVEMLGEIELLSRSGSKDDARLLAALGQFFENSDINAAAGRELMNLAADNAANQADDLPETP